MKRSSMIVVTLLCSLLMGASCNGVDPPPSTRIASFEASATSVARGEAVTLTWQIERAGSADGAPSCSLGRRAENEVALELLVVECSGSLTEVPEAPATSSFFRYQLNALKRPLDEADPYVTSVITVALEEPRFATSAGGVGRDIAWDVSALGDGGAIVAGSFEGVASFDITTLTSAGDADAFVARVNPDGSWAWAARAGGTGVDEAGGVSAMPDGSAIVTGGFTGVASFGETNLSAVGDADVFVARVNTDGSWAWVTQAGGEGYQFGTSVSALSDGGAIVAGYFDGYVQFGDTLLFSSGLQDVFVARVNPDGSWAWATRAGGTDVVATAWGVSALSGGGAIVAGVFDGTASFGSTSLTSAGEADVFVARVNADGSWAWAARGGGANSSEARGVSALSDGGAIVAGGFFGTASFGSTSLTSAGVLDVFVARVNADGSWAWAARAGGGSFDQAWDVSALSDGSAIVAGAFSGTASFGSTSLSSGSVYDAFLARVNADGSWAWATQTVGMEVEAEAGAAGVSAGLDGGVVVAGGFSGVVSFGGTSLTGDGEFDLFVSKIGPQGAW